jgi:hypothetical protein
LIGQADLATLNEALRGLRSTSATHEALVDPLLYCLVYGRTLVIENECLSRAEPSPLAEASYAVSRRFALLPSDFCCSSTGTVKFLSYINNLPFRNRSTYEILETALAAFIPLFEHVLTDLHRNNPLPQRIKGAYKYSEWDEPDPPEHSDDEDGWAAYEMEMRHWIMNRPLQLPDIPVGGYPGGIERRRHTVNLRGRTLQVIVSVHEIRVVRRQSYTDSVFSTYSWPCSTLAALNTHVPFGT